jgi:hypothetical protein
VTIAISPELFAQCRADGAASDFLREAGVAQADLPTSSVFVLRHKRRAVWLTWVHRMFMPRPPSDEPPRVPLPQNAATPSPHMA